MYAQYALSNLYSIYMICNAVRSSEEQLWQQLVLNVSQLEKGGGKIASQVDVLYPLNAPSQSPLQEHISNLKDGETLFKTTLGTAIPDARERESFVLGFWGDISALTALLFVSRSRCLPRQPSAHAVEAGKGHYNCRPSCDHQDNG